MPQVSQRFAARIGYGTLPLMTRNYLVATAAEAARVVERLAALGYGANAEKRTSGYVVTVEVTAPSVTIEETVVREAPSARPV